MDQKFEIIETTVQPVLSIRIVGIGKIAKLKNWESVSCQNCIS